MKRGLSAVLAAALIWNACAPANARTRARWRPAARLQQVPISFPVAHGTVSQPSYSTPRPEQLLTLSVDRIGVPLAEAAALPKGSKRDAKAAGALRVLYQGRKVGMSRLTSVGTGPQSAPELQTSNSSLVRSGNVEATMKQLRSASALPRGFEKYVEHFARANPEIGLSAEELSQRIFVLSDPDLLADLGIPESERSASRRIAGLLKRRDAIILRAGHWTPQEFLERIAFEWVRLQGRPALQRPRDNSLFFWFSRGWARRQAEPLFRRGLQRAGLSWDAPGSFAGEVELVESVIRTIDRRKGRAGAGEKAFAGLEKKGSMLGVLAALKEKSIFLETVGELEDLGPPTEPSLREKALAFAVGFLGENKVSGAEVGKTLRKDFKAFKSRAYRPSMEAIIARDVSAFEGGAWKKRFRSGAKLLRFLTLAPGTPRQVAGAAALAVFFKFFPSFMIQYLLTPFVHFIGLSRGAYARALVALSTLGFLIQPAIYGVSYFVGYLFFGELPLGTLAGTLVLLWLGGLITGIFAAVGVFFLVRWAMVHGVTSRSVKPGE